MYQPSFKGCWTLIDRAKQHRDTIDAYIQHTFRQKANLAEIRADRDPGVGYHRFRIKSVPDLSEFQEQVSAMVGDVIANLRSTLDHLAWQLACRHTNGNPKLPRRVQFPIEDKSSIFIERCHDCSGRGWLYEVSPSDQAIIEGFQPYKGREPEPVNIEGEWIHPFALLRNLSDTHKHRNLVSILMTPHSVMFLPGIKPGGMQLVDVLLFTRMPPSDVFEVGTEVMRAVLPPHIEANVEVAAYGAPAVTIDKKRPVLSTLDRVAAYTVLLLSKFDPTP